MRFLKNGSANVIDFGPAVIGSTDGRLLSPTTGLTNATVDEVGVYKHGATSLTSTTASAITHRAGGMYTVSLTTGFVDTLGRLTFYLRDDSACLPIREEFMVVPAGVYETLFGTTGRINANTDAINGSSVAALLAQAFYDASHYGGVAAYSSTGVTLTLSTGGSGANRTANFYEGQYAFVYSGPGAGQSREILSGTTALVQTLQSSFAVSPTTASSVLLMPVAPGGTAPTNWSALAITTAGVVSSNATVASTDIAAGIAASTVYPTNFSAMAITTGGVVTANTTLIEGSDATNQLSAAVNASTALGAIPTTPLLAASAPTNFGALAITTAGVVTANTTLIEGSDATDQINAAADAAIETYGLHQLVSAASTANPATNSYLGRALNASTAGTYNRTTDSLEALRNRGDVAWTGGSTATFPPNFAQLAISTAGVANANTVLIEGVDATNQLSAAVNASTALGAIPTNPLLATAAPTNFGSLSISTAGQVVSSNMRGTDSALLAASAPTNFGALAISTAGAIGTVTTLTNKTGFALGSTGFNAVTLTEPSAVPTWGSVTAAEGIAWNVAFNRNKMISNSTEVTLRNDADSGDIASAAVTATTASVTRSEYS